MFKLRVLSLTLALALLAPSAAQEQRTNCTIFNWDEQDPYVIGGQNGSRVSAAATCPEGPANRTCAIRAEGDDLIGGGWNLTDIRYNHDLLFWAVRQGINNDTLLAPGFNHSIAGAIDGIGVLQPGQSGYLNFSAYQYCYTGSIAGCVGEVDNGTAIQVCAPVWHHEGDSIRLDGRYSMQNISADDVDQYSDPFAGQVDNGGAAVMLTGKMSGGLAVLARLAAVMAI